MSDLPVVQRRNLIRGSDSLIQINDIITERLNKYECFDLDIDRSRLKAVYRVVKARDLEWFDPELEIDDCVTMVIGVKGSDFDKHEDDR